LIIAGEIIEHAYNPDGLPGAANSLYVRVGISTPVDAEASVQNIMKITRIRGVIIGNAKGHNNVPHRRMIAAPLASRTIGLRGSGLEGAISHRTGTSSSVPSNQLT